MHRFPREYRQTELVLWLKAQDFTHYITLNYNDGGVRGLAAKEGKLKEFYKRLNRWVLGLYWHKKVESLLHLIAFPEHIATNMHYHCLLKLPEGKQEKVERAAIAIWEKLVPGGQCHVLPYDGDAALLYYVTKESAKSENWEATLILPMHR